MKLLSLPVALSFMFASALLKQDQCQTQPIKPKMGAVSRTPIHDITLRLDHADVDEHLLALARAEDCNVIADASHFPQKTALMTEETTDSLGNFLLIIAYQRDLTWEKVSAGSNGRGTFVFWADQDVKPLARAILSAPVPWINRAVSEQEWQPVLLPQTEQYKWRAFIRRNPDEFWPGSDDTDARMIQRSLQVGARLMPYLRATYGWTRESPHFDQQIPVATLPLELRNDLLGRLQGQMFHPRKLAIYDLWLKRDFSPLARALVVKDDDPVSNPNQSLFFEDYSPDNLKSRRWLNWILPPYMHKQNTEEKVPALQVHPVVFTTELTTPKLRLVHADTNPQDAGTPPLQNANQLALPTAASPSPAQDAVLQKEVSFEIKRQPLASLLRTLSEQNKVTLTVNGGADPETPVTARVHALSLSETMTALAHVYRALWVKTGDDSYELRPSGKSGLQIKVEQLGEAGWFRTYRRMGQGRPSAHVTPFTVWKSITEPLFPNAPQLVPTTNQQDFTQGILVSALPQDVRQQIRTEIQDAEATEVVTMYRDTSLRNLSQAVLSIHYTPPRRTQQGTSTDSNTYDIFLTALGFNELRFDIPTLLNYLPAQ